LLKFANFKHFKTASYEFSNYAVHTTSLETGSVSRRLAYRIDASCICRSSTGLRGCADERAVQASSYIACQHKCITIGPLPPPTVWTVKNFAYGYNIQP